MNRWGHLPLLVGFPRSGNHFVNAVLELYFDRHRAPPQDGGLTFLPGKSSNYMWLSIHDHHLDIIPQNSKGAILLVRDPVDVMYSWTSLNRNKSEFFIKSETRRYNSFIGKWNKIAGVKIYYENFLKTPDIPIQKVSNFFDVPFDKEKALEAVSVVSKEKLHKKANRRSRYHGVKHLSAEYQDSREAFRKQWASVIYSMETTNVNKTKNSNP